MKLNKIFKLSLGVLFAIPTSFFLGGEILASHFSSSDQPLMHNENHLLACGGGGGGGGGGTAPRRISAWRVAGEPLAASRSSVRTHRTFTI